MLLIVDPPDLDSLPLDPPYFSPCSTTRTRCMSGPEFQCAPGYTDVQCSACKPGQFYFEGFCDVPCSAIEPRGAVTFFGILAVVVVWVILNKSAGSMYAFSARPT